MKKVFKFVVVCLGIFVMVFSTSIVFAPASKNTSVTIKCDSSVSVNFVSLGAPSINSSFKTYMDYRSERNTGLQQILEMCFMVC